jgi:hypothetical protein
VHRRLAALLVVVALASAVGACGDDDDAGARRTTSGATSFCSRATAVDRQFDDLDSAVGAAGVPSRESLLKAATSVDSLVVAAPRAVRSDLRTVAGGVRRIADLLGEVDLSDRAALDDPQNAPKLEQMSAEMERLGNQVQAASARVAKYLHDRCGIDTGATTSSTTPTTAATTTTLG